MLPDFVQITKYVLITTEQMEKETKTCRLENIYKKEKLCRWHN